MFDLPSSAGNAAENRNTFFDTALPLATLVHVRLPVDDEHLLVRQEQVTIVIAQVVGISFLGAVDLGEVTKVESCQLQVLPGHCSLAQRTKLL